MATDRQLSKRLNKNFKNYTPSGVYGVGFGDAVKNLVQQKKTTLDWDEFNFAKLYLVPPGLSDAEIRTHLGTVEKSIQQRVGVNKQAKDLIKVLQKLPDTSNHLKDQAWVAAAEAILSYAKPASGTCGASFDHMIWEKTLVEFLESEYGITEPQQTMLNDFANQLKKQRICVLEDFDVPADKIPQNIQSALAKTDRRTLVHLVGFHRLPENPTFEVINTNPVNISDIDKSSNKAAKLDAQGYSNALALIKKTVGNDEQQLHLLVIQNFIYLLKNALQTTAPARAVDLLEKLGLKRTDIPRLYLALIDSGDAQSKSSPWNTVINAIASGQLLAARMEANKLSVTGANDDKAADTLKALETQEKRVKELKEQFDQHIAASDFDAAHTTFTELTQTITDDESLLALGKNIPPGEVRSLSLALDSSGTSVEINWFSGSRSDTATKYRIIRKEGAAPTSISDGETVTEVTNKTQAVDKTPPIGAIAHYAVAATNGGRYSPIASTSITLAPPVSNVTVLAEETSLSLSWRAAPGTTAVEVQRSGPDGVTTTTVGPTEGIYFSKLKQNTTYTLSITAIYGEGQQERKSAPTRATGITRGKISPVKSLHKKLSSNDNGTSSVQLSWTAIPGYESAVYAFPTSDAPKYGDKLTLEKIVNYKVTGTPFKRGNQEGIAADLPSGVFTYAVVTFNETTAIAGANETIGLSHPLTTVEAKRYGDTTIVSWVWPDGIDEVSGRYSGPSGQGHTTISRTTYQQQGGLRLNTGRERTKITLRTITRNHQTSWESPEYTINLDSIAIDFVYSVSLKRGGFLKNRSLKQIKYVIESTSEDVNTSIEVVPVLSNQQYAPISLESPSITRLPTQTVEIRSVNGSRSRGELIVDTSGEAIPRTVALFAAPGHPPIRPKNPAELKV